MVVADILGSTIYQNGQNNDNMLKLNISFIAGYSKNIISVMYFYLEIFGRLLNLKRNNCFNL